MTITQNNDNLETFRRRSNMRKAFVTVSKVLIFGYHAISDAAMKTFEAIDAFDWEDKLTKQSKGYVYPAIETIAALRMKDKRTIERHVAELIEHGLLTRERRANRPSVLYIEDPNEVEVDKCLALLDKVLGQEHKANDKNVVSPQERQTTKMSFAIYNKKNKIKNNVNGGQDLKKGRLEALESVRVHSPNLRTDKNVTSQIPERIKMPGVRSGYKKGGGERGGVDSLGSIIARYGIPVVEATDKPDYHSKRDFTAGELADDFSDQKSLGVYRLIAERVPQMVIYETRASVLDAANKGKIRKSKGALFVSIIKSYCKKKGIDLGFKEVRGSRA